MSNHTPGTSSPASSPRVHQGAPTGAPPLPVGVAAVVLLECAKSWEPEERLLGNVRAMDIVALCESVIQPSPASESATIAQDAQTERFYEMVAERSRAHAELDALGVQPSSRYTRDVPSLDQRIRSLRSARSSSEPSVTTDAETGGVVSRRQFDALRERTAKLLCGLNDEINRLEAELRDLRSARSPESSPAVDAGTTDAPTVEFPAGDGGWEETPRIDDAELVELVTQALTDPNMNPDDVTADALALDLRDARIEMARLRATRSPAVDDETVSRDWTEDFAHENGMYSCRCYACGNEFTGHKRRVTCKRCAARRSPESAPEANNAK